MKRCIATAALMVLVATAAMASAGGEAGGEAGPGQPPPFDVVVQFNNVVTARFGDLDLLQVADTVCSFVTTVLADQDLHKSYVLEEEAAAEYSPVEIAEDRWQDYGVKLLHLGDGPGRRTYILIVDQDLFAAFVEQQAQYASELGVAEPALSLFKDMLWEYAPRLSILPADNYRDRLIEQRLKAVRRATCPPDDEFEGAAPERATKVGRRGVRALAFLGGGALYAIDSRIEDRDVTGRAELAKELGRAMVRYGMFGLASLVDE